MELLVETLMRQQYKDLSLVWGVDRKIRLEDHCLVYCDAMTVAFNDVITFSDVNLNDSVHDVHYNQYISNTWEFSIFNLPSVG